MKNKKIILIASAVILVLAVFAVCVAGSKDKSNIIFTDSTGQEIATVSYDGENETVRAADEGYSDYVKIALEEAVEFYGERTGTVSENLKAEFFEKVSTVKTNFSTFNYEKIVAGLNDSVLEEDTPFASVIVDGRGRITATYSFSEENGKTYTLNKTYAGSAIKPLSVYAPAIESKTVHWSTQIMDAPIKKITTGSEGIREWPANASGTYTNENMLICDALYKSINTVAVRTLKRTDVKYTVDFLDKKLGMNIEAEKRILAAEDEDEIYGNIALGYLVEGVSPLDMAGYYQIFINGGEYTEPYAVASITDKEGKTFEKKPAAVRVISAETASVMAKMLEGVVREGGTGKEAFVRNMNVAGKSGTSDENYDNWFVGFTNKFVCSVWHGYNDEPKNSAPALFGKIISQFPESDGRIPVSKGVYSALYCKKSGGLRGKGCYDTSVGYYLKDSVPAECTQCGK